MVNKISAHDIRLLTNVCFGICVIEQTARYGAWPLSTIEYWKSYSDMNAGGWRKHIGKDIGKYIRKKNIYIYIGKYI